MIYNKLASVFILIYFFLRQNEKLYKNCKYC